MDCKLNFTSFWPVTLEIALLEADTLEISNLYRITSIYFKYWHGIVLCKIYFLNEFTSTGTGSARIREVDDILKIGRKRLTEVLNDKGVCRTAPATPGLINILNRYTFSYLLVMLVGICLSVEGLLSTGLPHPVFVQGWNVARTSPPRLRIPSFTYTYTTSLRNTKVLHLNPK